MAKNFIGTLLLHPENDGKKVIEILLLHPESEGNKCH
jgi:hypothetical protein